MFDRVQRDRFWLFLGAVLIALFVIQKERGIVEPREASRYDRGGMTRLVEKTIEIPVLAAQPAARRPLPRPQVVQAVWNDPHADLITGSLRAPAPRPLARPGRGGAIVTNSLAALGLAARVGWRALLCASWVLQHHRPRQPTLFRHSGP